MRVWVTRDEQPGGPLCTALEHAGLTAVLEPVVKRRVTDDAADSMSMLDADDWLVLTSVYAIEAVAPGPARVPRVAVVGEASRRRAKERGFRVELVSAGGDRESLFRELRTKARKGRVCYPRSSRAAPPEPWSGIDLLSPVLYETAPRDFDRTVIERVDVISVASPSAVETVGTVDLGLRPGCFASIGPSTSNALRRFDIEPWIEAQERSFESLAQAIAARASDCHRRQA